jgi:hypothetical protein
MAHNHARRGHTLDQVRVLVVDEDEFGSAVVEDIVDLVLCEADVDGDDDGSGGNDALQCVYTCKNC